MAETKTKEKEKSQKYLAYEKLIEIYKKQNPTKYESKKAELERKLAALA